MKLVILMVAAAHATIVKINNDACTAMDGTMGTCYYTDSECTRKGGEERGKCASGFGVCCVGKRRKVGFIKQS